MSRVSAMARISSARGIPDSWGEVRLLTRSSQAGPRSRLRLRAMEAVETPDRAERSEAALLRRLDRMNKHSERLEREARVGNEALAIFVRT